jgi:hypothetical protein
MVHHRLRVFDIRAERNIFEPKGEEVTEGWEKKTNWCMGSFMIDSSRQASFM